jgi:hypothetical protein
MKMAVDPRIIRTVIIGLFVILLASGLLVTYMLAERTTVDPASYAHAGMVVKQKFAEYADRSDEDVGRQLYGKGYITQEQNFTLKSRGLTDNDIAHLVAMKAYSPEQKALFYIVYIILWSSLLAGVLQLLSYLEHVPVSEFDQSEPMNERTEGSDGE